jgi:hypothetical protein
VYHGCPTFCLTLHIDRIVKSKAFAFSDPEIYKLLNSIHKLFRTVSKVNTEREWMNW